MGRMYYKTQDGTLVPLTFAGPPGTGGGSSLVVAEGAEPPADLPVGSLFYDTDFEGVIDSGVAAAIDTLTARIDTLTARIPRGVRTAGWVAPGYSLTTGGEVVYCNLTPYTDAGRLYEVTIECPSLDPAGFAAGLLIVGPRIGGVNLWSNDLHLYLAAGYQGFQGRWLFHSGTGGNDVNAALRTTSTMKLGTLGMRVVLTDLGPSDKTVREQA